MNERLIKFLLILVFLGVIGGMGIRMSSAFKEAYRGLKALAILALGFAIGRSIVSLITPRIAIWKGSRVASLGFYGLAAVGIGYITMPFSFYPYLRILHGIFSGIAWPSMQAIVMSLTPVNKRARVSSLYLLFGMTGAGIAYAIGGVFTNYALIFCTFLLAFVASTLAILNVNVKERAKKEERSESTKNVLIVSELTILASSLALGMIMAIVESEITVELFYQIFGKVVGGLLLGFSSTAGAVIGYFVGKKYLDIRQSIVSLVLPAASAYGSAAVTVFGGVLSPLGVMGAKASLTWWRSANLALTKGKRTGLKIGLDNFGRTVGIALSSGILGACGTCEAIVLITSLAIFGAGIASAAGFSSPFSRWRSPHRLK